MSEVFFYHLTNSTLEQTLVQLLERSLHNNWRVLVRSGDKQQMQQLDDRLWGGNTPQFIPHGISGSENDADQPILLTLDNTNSNAAHTMMLVQGAKATAAEVMEYERVSLIFNGNEADALQSAREDWKTMVDAGISAKYWSQASGKWDMKAEKNS